MVTGCSNFRTSTLARHVESSDHQDSVKDGALRNSFTTAAKNVMSQKTDAVICAMRCAYWLGKEGIATSKFSSLLRFCQVQNCEALNKLDQGKNATYTSWQTAEEMQQCIEMVINEKNDKNLKDNGMFAILIDESTDIVVTKKLVVYGRTVDDCFKQHTFFLGNIPCQESSVTAQVLFDKLSFFLEKKGLKVEDIFAFGSDGASIMVGRKNGVAAKIKEKNPFAINVHCFAHRLALCTSKAAEDVPYIGKVFQETLTEMFRYFKRSTDRTAQLRSIQKVLDHDEVKLKEVHAIRWFAFYEALYAVYLTWKPLVTYFKNVNKPSEKEQQILKTLTDIKFLKAMHMLMDVVPSFAQLNLVFQKQNIDIAAVPGAVDGVKQAISKAKSASSHYQKELQDKLVKEGDIVKYKGEKLCNKDFKKAAEDSRKVRQDFLDRCESNLDKRFPKSSTEIAFAFKSLGLRPLTLLSADEKDSFGNNDLEQLLNFYGEDRKTATGSASKALINSNACRLEWSLLKKVVLDQKYPRDSLSELWQIINKYHSTTFPNLLVLARLALLTPLQSADCERGFSCQNNLHTPSRNRLKPDTLQRLMTIQLEGPDIESFDFPCAVQKWTQLKERRIFSA